MTPKQKYDERKRLRLENQLRAEQRKKDEFDRMEEGERQMIRILEALERLADVAELWADKQAA